MASIIDICNLALSRLSASRITSLNDNTIEAKTLNAIYNQVAENVMGMGPWTSVVKRATLAQLTTVPEYQFNYMYQLPTNPKCIKLLRINEQKLGNIEFSIEGDVLLTNTANVQIKYIGFITDTESYDSYLRQAITERLIVELSYARTGEYKINQGLEQAFQAKVEMWLNENNTQGNSDNDLPSDTFVDVRNDN